MKILSLLALFAILAVVFDFNKKEEIENNSSFQNYKSFVRECHQQVYRFNQIEWNELESNYRQLQIEAENLAENSNDINFTDYIALQKEWDNFSKYYAEECVIRDRNREMEAFSNELLPPGVAADLKNVEEDTFGDVQSHFEHVIAVHKNELSDEKLNLVNSLWIVFKAKEAELNSILEARQQKNRNEQKANIHQVLSNSSDIIARNN